MILRSLAICAVLLVTASCVRSSGEVEQRRANAPADAVAVERIFTIDGCTGYRFVDYGGYVKSFVKCDSGSVAGAGR